MKREPVKIGLIGLGTVGGGVVKILQNNALLIEERLGRQLILKRVCDLEPKKAKDLGFDEKIFTKDASEIFEDPEISIVVEVIGGVHPAREYILKAIERGKHVVTANKEVLAKHGAEFYRLAAEKKVYLLSEGAVAGGIPILRPLRSSLSAEEIKEVFGIINGTTNYILSQMAATGASFEEVLKVAQTMGIAEANPEDDLSGRDAAYKAVILATHAFRTVINFEKVSFEGISRIEKQDISYAAEFGYTIKLLAVLRQENEQQISVMVYPALVSLNHQLAKVSQHFNAIYVRGSGVGEVMFYGPGAGALPTGSAVLSDIIEIANLSGKEYDPTVLPVSGTVKILKESGEISGQFYLRLWVSDQVGVLEAIAGVFARQGVSIAAVIQKAVVRENAEIVILTHEVKTKNIEKAVAEISKLPTTGSVKNVLRVGI
jgi:homoserine dehydrogenase